jgi:hypothetical protein
VLELQSQLRPVTAKARWRTQFRLQFTNWGNAPVRLVLKATDPDDQLGFAFSQDAVLVPIGGTVGVRLKARPRKPFLRGSPVRLPFTVTGEPPGSTSGQPSGRPQPTPFAPPDPSRPVLEGAVEQRPVISRGVVTLAMLVALLLAGLTAFVLKSGGVKGAQETDGAPGTPGGVTVTAVSADRLRVGWTAVDRATGYQVVVVVDPATGARSAPEVVAGAATVHEVKLTAAGTQGCIVVAATRGENVSTVSAQVCDTLPDDSLPAPTGVAVTAKPDGTLDVSWTAQPEFDHRVLVDGAAQQQDVKRPAARMTTTVVPPAATCVTVTVIAVDGDRVSPEGAQGAAQCVNPVPVPGGATAPGGVPGGAGNPGAGGTPGGAGSTPPTSGTTSSTPPTLTPSSTPLTAWVAQLGPDYVEPPLAEAGRRRAVDAGIEQDRIVVATPADLPAQTDLVGTARLVVVNGFPDQPSVVAFCAQEPQATLGCAPLETGQGG